MERARGKSPGDSIQVFLLIENRLLREALTRLFRKRSDLCIARESSHSELAPHLIADSPCAVLLTDDFDAASSAVQSIPKNKWAVPEIRVVLIAMEEDEEQFLVAVRFGVAGYLLKDASAGDVANAVRAVARGEAVCPPRLCMSLFRWAAEEAREIPSQMAGPKPSLTFRQQQLVSLVAKGLTNKEIASHLNLSQFTVKNHIHRIMKQVDAESRYEAVETIRASGYAVIS